MQSTALLLCHSTENPSAQPNILNSLLQNLWVSILYSESSVLCLRDRKLGFRFPTQLRHRGKVNVNLFQWKQNRKQKIFRGRDPTRHYKKMFFWMPNFCCDNSRWPMGKLWFLGCTDTRSKTLFPSACCKRSVGLVSDLRTSKHRILYAFRNCMVQLSSVHFATVKNIKRIKRSIHSGIVGHTFV